MQTQLESFNDKIFDVQRRTLWKIQDLENILLTRITKDYVDDSVRLIEDKMRRELMNSVRLDHQAFEKQINDLTMFANKINLEFTN